MSIVRDDIDIIKHSLQHYFVHHCTYDDDNSVSSLGWNDVRKIGIPMSCRNVRDQSQGDLCTVEVNHNGYYLQEWMVVKLQSTKPITHNRGDKFVLNCHGTNLISVAHCLRGGELHPIFMMPRGRPSFTGRRTPGSTASAQQTGSRWEYSTAACAGCPLLTMSGTSSRMLSQVAATSSCR